MKSASGPYMQKPGRGPMMKTGRGIPMELQGPLSHKPGHNPTDPPVGTTYEVVVNDDTGNQTGLRATDSSGNVRNYDRPTNAEIRHSKERISKGLDTVSPFSQKHTYKSNLIFVDGKPRTDFTQNTGYAMDSQNIRNAIRSAGQDPANVHMGNLKIKNPKVHQMIVDAFNSDTANQTAKLQSQNSLVAARSTVKERPELAPNMYKKKK